LALLKSNSAALTLWHQLARIYSHAKHEKCKRTIKNTSMASTARRPSKIGGGSEHDLSAAAPVWYENPSGVVIRPDNTKHTHRWSGQCCDWFS